MSRCILFLSLSLALALRRRLSLRASAGLLPAAAAPLPRPVLRRRLPRRWNGELAVLRPEDEEGSVEVDEETRQDLKEGSV